MELHKISYTLVINRKHLGITLLLSLIAGLLFDLWLNILDPKGTGGSILALPVILTLFIVCIAIFVTGLINIKNPFGRYLAAASIIIPIVFFISKELLQMVIN